AGAPSPSGGPLWGKVGMGVAGSKRLAPTRPPPQPSPRGGGRYTWVAPGLLVEEPALEEAPGVAVVQVKAPVGAEVLAGEELPVRLGHEAHQLLVAQQLEFVRRDRAARTQRALFHAGSIRPPG